MSYRANPISYNRYFLTNTDIDESEYQIWYQTGTNTDYFLQVGN